MTTNKQMKQDKRTERSLKFVFEFQFNSVKHQVPMHLKAIYSLSTDFKMILLKLSYEEIRVGCSLHVPVEHNKFSAVAVAFTD